jgi:hypothetical protein
MTTGSKVLDLDLITADLFDLDATTADGNLLAVDAICARGWPTWS